MSFEHWSDILALWYKSVVSVFGIGISSFLIYTMYTSKERKSLNHLIITRTVTFCNLCSSIFTFMTSTRMFFVDQSLIYTFQGPCTLVYGNEMLTNLLCYYCYTSALHMSIILQFLLIYSYIYRFLALRTERLATSSVKIRCYGTTFAFVVYYHAIFFFGIDKKADIEEILEIARPEMMNSTYLGLVDYNATVYVLSEKFTEILPFVVVIVAAVSHFKITKKLNSTLWNKQIHRSILKSLRIQTIFPILEVIAIYLCYFCNRFLDIEVPILENFIQIPMVTMSAVTPILVFIFVDPYKTKIRQLFGQAVERTVLPLNVIRN